jgi:hypothetical protein
MKRIIILTFTLVMALTGFSKDYKVENLKKITKGNFKITRLLILTDSLVEPEINKFIEDFTLTLKTEFENNNLMFLCFRKGMSTIKDFHTNFENLNPDGVMEFSPSYNFIWYKGFYQKTGLSFKVNLSYRTLGVEQFTHLFTTRIGVTIDSFEKSGIPAAHELFKKMVEDGYLSINEKSN